MKTVLVILSVGLLLGSSCRNKNPNLNKEDLKVSLEGETTAKAAVPDIPEGYTPPAGIQYSPKRDNSKPLVRLDVVAGLQREHPAKLSEFAKEVVYYKLDSLDEMGSLVQIVPVPGGYLGGTYEGIWLLKEDFSKDRLLVKYDVAFHNDGGFYYLEGKSLIKYFCYDPATGIVHYLYYQRSDDSKNGGKQYIGFAPLEEWIAASSPIDVKEMKQLIKSSNNNLIFRHKQGFGTSGYFTDGFYTFDEKGDTLCFFSSGMKSEFKPAGTIRNAESSDYYLYNGSLYYRQAYVDTVFRVEDASTFQPVYKIDMGKYQVSKADGMSISYDLSDKYLVNGLVETDDRLFLVVTQNYACPNTCESGTVKFFQLIYDKKTGELYSFTDRARQSYPGGIPNDLDGGLPFWPDMQIEGKPYMKRNGKQLRKQYSEAVINKVPVLKNLKDSDILLITIK